jgi:hypothetical protein
MLADDVRKIESALSELFEGRQHTDSELLGAYHGLIVRIEELLEGVGDEPDDAHILGGGLMLEGVTHSSKSALESQGEDARYEDAHYMDEFKLRMTRMLPLLTARGRETIRQLLKMRKDGWEARKPMLLLHLELGWIDTPPKPEEDPQ